MKLFCVRHGEAFSADEDPNRALTPKGNDDVARVANYLKTQDVHMDEVLHSQKLRAKQTANIFANALSVDQINETDTLLDAEGDVTPLADMIPGMSGNVMLVGHLPFLYKLISELVINDENNYPLVNYPPGTVVCLEYGENQRWVISWILRPDLV